MQPKTWRDLARETAEKASKLWRGLRRARHRDDVNNLLSGGALLVALGSFTEAFSATNSPFKRALWGTLGFLAAYKGRYRQRVYPSSHRLKHEDNRATLIEDVARPEEILRVVCLDREIHALKLKFAKSAMPEKTLATIAAHINDLRKDFNKLAAFQSRNVNKPVQVENLVYTHRYKAGPDDDREQTIATIPLGRVITLESGYGLTRRR